MLGPEFLPPEPFEETLSINQSVLLNDLRNFNYKKIVWDLDDTLGNTQDVVKEMFDKALKTNYRKRIIDEFDGLSRWAAEDGIISYEIAKALEAQLWTSRILLARVLPYPEMQEYSKKAAEKGKVQYIDTSRTGRLKQVTLDWSGLLYPWIPPENIKITPNKDVRYDADHKTLTTIVLDPDIVVDDNPEHILMALNATTRTRFVWLALGQDFRKLQHERVLTLPGGPEQFGLLMSHNLDTPSLI